MVKMNTAKSGCCSSMASTKKMSPEKLHECITKKAKEIWEKRGRPQGMDNEIWLEAERIVKNGC